MPRRILLPLDRSHRSDETLAALADVCQPGDEITLLAVARPPARAQLGTRPARAVTHFSDPSGTARLAPGRETPIFETPEQAEERKVTELNAYLNARADQLQRIGFRVHVQPLVDRRPARAIVAYARAHPPDAIVLARRTRDPRRWLFGSVSRALSRAEVAPLILLPHSGRSQSTRAP